MADLGLLSRSPQPAGVSRSLWSTFLFNTVTSNLMHEWVFLYRYTTDLFGVMIWHRHVYNYLELCTYNCLGACWVVNIHVWVTDWESVSTGWATRDTPPWWVFASQHDRRSNLPVTTDRIYLLHMWQKFQQNRKSEETCNDTQQSEAVSVSSVCLLFISENRRCKTYGSPCQNMGEILPPVWHTSQ